jgi:succinate-semialdehyde dehydrogenase/glutarate-semialdehyde dehydrogenase
MPFESRNPATGELLETFPEVSPGELDRSVERAWRAFLDWRARSFAERARPLREAARRLRERKEELARTMALEMGKPLVQGEAEIEKCALACGYFADEAEEFLAPAMRSTEARRSYVRFDPLGPILAIMPWNFPFWQVFRFAAPSLAAGNVCLVKHAPNVPRCALAIEELMREAGFPEGVFQAPRFGVAEVGRLLADPRIRGVTLTGSTGAGRAVAETAGRHLKKVVLELGGSDPFVVLDDADLDETVRAAATARLQNSGQSCIAAKRFVVVEGVADRFVEGLAREMARFRVGDPLRRETDLGPLARQDLRDALHRQVEESLRRGARRVLGGVRPEGPGWFYPPTILVSVSPGMPAFDEETFGPVASVIRVRDEEQALQIANASSYGLGASIWTADRERGERLAARIDAGSVFVNAVVRSDPRLPFGGVKDSGFGRELSEFGIREFVNVKTVWVA